MMGKILDLAVEWRSDAATLHKYGDERGAKMLLTLAEDAVVAVERVGDEVLTLPEAAMHSGYTPAHLGRLVREGKLPNLGRTNAPRVRRADVPIKRARLSEG